MEHSAPLLELHNVSKSFGGVRVLHEVSFDIRPGEVHALTGENGAGKSTLMNIVSGVVSPDSGQMLWTGRPAHLRSPREAQALGIGFVHQELALVPQLSVAENIFLGRHPATRGFVSLGEMNRRTRDALESFGHSIDPRRPVASLSLAERQLVEIARAVVFQSRLIIMDEPTAPLDERECASVFQSIRRLRARGVSVIYISHRLKEIFEIADRITVLRDGRRVLTCPAPEISQEELVRAMVGDKLAKRPAGPISPTPPSDEVLRLEGAHSFTVRRGEIVGLAGLAGAGRTRLLESLFGARYDKPSGLSMRRRRRLASREPQQSQSNVFVNGRRVHLRSPVDAVRAGFALVPDDRKSKGLVLGASVLNNIALAAGRARFFISRQTEEGAAGRFMASLRIKAAGLHQPVIYLSGGTQQKVVLAKWLFAGARVFLLDEPTRGIDVGAKAEIYDAIRMLANDGAAVLVASSELEELTGLADRILVMHRGRIAGELARADVTEERVMRLATGGVN